MDADKKITIQSITIKNFRSIRRETFKTTNFNIFVGNNDAGKSNILKALNLFFNGKVEDKVPYDYKRDFTYLFPPKSKEAKAIIISIHFSVPKSFSDSGIYVWEKVWKESGLVADIIKDLSGNIPSPRSKIPSALRKIKYRYVPAVKSPDYYKTLLGDLYASVAASLDTDFKESVENFSYALSTYTEAITLDVSKRLHLSSRLSIPADLNTIFQALVFQTSRTITDTNSVPLTSRGDGIQARHIPIILKYIAKVDQTSRNQGSAKITTIWGFEEPENGLELSNAFALSSEFIEYSNEIQIFLTTHSPAFYMKKEIPGVKVMFVEKRNTQSDETEIVSGINNTHIAESMGLMPLVAPFIAEQVDRYNTAREIYTKNFLTDVPTIMVEGETDVDYLKMAIKHLSPQLNKMIEDEKLRIVYKLDGAGCTQLKDWALAWIYSGFKSKAYVLFDKDVAGIEARDSILSSEAYKLRQQNVRIKIANIGPTNDITDIFAKKVKFVYEIEHLCSYDVWDMWKKKKVVNLREDSEMRQMFDGLVPRNKTLDNIIDDLFTDLPVKNTILTFEPAKLKKKKMVSILQEHFDDKAQAFAGFSRTIQDIEKYFAD